MMYYFTTMELKTIVIPEHQIKKIYSRTKIHTDGYKDVIHFVETMDDHVIDCTGYETRQTIQVPLGRYLLIDKYACEDDEENMLFSVENVLAFEYTLRVSYENDEHLSKGTISSYFTDEVSTYVSVVGSESRYLLDLHLYRLIDFDSVASLTKESLERELLSKCESENYHLDKNLSLEQILKVSTITLYKNKDKNG